MVLKVFGGRINVENMETCLTDGRAQTWKMWKLLSRQGSPLPEPVFGESVEKPSVFCWFCAGSRPHCENHDLGRLAVKREPLNPATGRDRAVGQARRAYFQV